MHGDAVDLGDDVADDDARRRRRTAVFKARDEGTLPRRIRADAEVAAIAIASTWSSTSSSTTRRSVATGTARSEPRSSVRVFIPITAPSASISGPPAKPRGICRSDSM